MKDRLIELIHNAEIEHLSNGIQMVENALNEDLICPIENRQNFIADYLLENGVIVPPCKVGDKVYYVSKNPFCLAVRANIIYEAEVVRIVTTHLGTSLIIQIRDEDGCCEVPNLNDWGKTLFPTREEALAKLKEGGE